MRRDVRADVTKGRGTGAGSDRRNADAIRALKQFIHTELVITTSIRLHVIGPVRRAQEIARAAGLVVEGYKLVVENGTLRHTLRHHGDVAAESQRGQVAVTKRDLCRLPQLLAEFDAIYPAEATKQGTRQIRLEKHIGKTLYTVYAEVRRSAKQVAFKTMIKRGIRKPVSP